jgi:uncharacterized protein YjiS (DUF1127 family)
MTYQHIPMASYRQHHPTTADLAGGFSPAGLAGRLLAEVRGRFALMQKRRGYRKMLQWDNCRLKDIGVTREDVRDALRLCGGRA